jgi:hypothetical protein
VDVKEEKLKLAEAKTKSLLKKSAKIRLDAARAGAAKAATDKAAAAAGEEVVPEEVSEEGSGSEEDDDMFEMMEAYYSDEDYMDMEK